MTPRVRAEVSLLATTVIWGSTFAVAKLAMTGMSAQSLMIFRFSAASVFFLVFFWRHIIPIPLAAMKKGTILGTLLFLGFIAQTIGLNYTTASKSAFITSMMVVFTPFLQVLISKKSPTIGNVLGIVVVCGGLWLFTSPEGSSFNLGDGLTLLCALLFAIYIVYLDVVSKTIPTLQLSFLQVASCAVLSWGLILPMDGPVLPASSNSWVALAYLTIFATFLTTLVQTRFQQDTTPTRAVIIFSVEPLFATLFASLLLNEVIGSVGLIGGMLIVGGILLSELSDLVPGLRNPVMVRNETR